MLILFLIECSCLLLLLNNLAGNGLVFICAAQVPRTFRIWETWAGLTLSFVYVLLVAGPDDAMNGQALRLMLSSAFRDFLSRTRPFRLRVLPSNRLALRIRLVNRGVKSSNRLYIRLMLTVWWPKTPNRIRPWRHRVLVIPLCRFLLLNRLRIWTLTWVTPLLHVGLTLWLAALTPPPLVNCLAIPLSLMRHGVTTRVPESTIRWLASTLWVRRFPTLCLSMAGLTIILPVTIGI